MPLPERVDWDQLEPDFIEAWGYPRGEFMPEHLAIYGPNGSGKSYFEKTILLRRAELRGSHAVILATKPADSTLQSMGWPIVTTWPPGHGEKYRRVIYQATARNLRADGKVRQRQAVEHLFESLWRPNSNIILAVDEIAYVEQDLGLRTLVTRYYREARALGITIVAGTQRPQGVSRWMHSESKWKIAFAPADEDDCDRVAQVLGNKLYFRTVLNSLDTEKREFVIVHTLTKQCFISHISNGPKQPVKEVKEAAPRARALT